MLSFATADLPTWLVATAVMVAMIGFATVDLMVAKAVTVDATLNIAVVATGQSWVAMQSN
jgi:hypothetical protein